MEEEKAKKFGSLRHNAGILAILNISVLLVLAICRVPDTTAEDNSLIRLSQKVRRRAQVTTYLQAQEEDNCGISGHPEEIPVSATWAASYPGSGSKLTWKLIQAFTGIATGDDYHTRALVGRGVVAAVKTHYPSHTPEALFSAPEFANIDRAILLLRNPLTSIPSYHNFVYEQKNGLRGHSTRAPVEEWIKWRNEFLEKELQAWVDHAEWWIEKYKYRNALLHVLPFEKLTGNSGEQTGIHTLKQLAGFLASGDQRVAEHMVQPEKLDCIWYLYVKKSSVPGEEDDLKSHRQGGPNEYPFTVKHLDSITEALMSLWSRHMFDRTSSPSIQLFCNLLLEYVDVIEKKKRHVQLTR